MFTVVLYIMKRLIYARAKLAREKNRVILLYMSRLLCFLMKIESKIWCLRTI